MLGAFRSWLTQSSRIRHHIKPTDWNLHSRKLSSIPINGGRKSRLPAYARRTGYLALGLGTTWAVDRTFNASAVSRNFMTLWTVSSVFLYHTSVLPGRILNFLMQCAIISLDYKLNFTPEKSHLIPELHERVAERMYNLFTSNGGLYIKIGTFRIYLQTYRKLIHPFPRSGDRR
jgi:hypothetical protein